MSNKCIKWNDEIKLIITDVDDTVAEIFENISLEVVNELNKLLSEGKIIFFISGQGINNIYSRVISFLDKKYLNQVIVAHCNGSEIYGFNEQGMIESKPIFTVYDLFTNNIDKSKIKTVVKEVLEYFSLVALPPMSLQEFKQKTEGRANYVMVDDRNVQIAIDFVNTIDIHDFSFENCEFTENKSDDVRNIICNKSKEIINKYNLPLEPCMAGTCAVDFNYIGVDKGLPIKQIIEFGSKFEIDLPNKIIVSKESEIEIWGDCFTIDSGSDRKMSYALPKGVRSISFRDLDEEDQDDNYNVVQWNGKKRCNEGLLEFLTERNKYKE